MIAGGTDVATVAGILGHSQPSTTLDIYTHAFDKNKKAASAGLQGMLEIWHSVIAQLDCKMCSSGQIRFPFS